jgi:spore germination protein KC
MKNRLLALMLIVSILLSGCWDEAQYKDVTIATVMGVSKDDEKVKSIFSFPTFEQESIKYSQTEGTGISTGATRDDASHRTMEALGLFHLEVLLVSSEIAKQDLNEPLDIFFRTPRNRITSYIAIVEGDMEQYFKPPGDLKEEVSDFYPELLRTAVLYTFVAENELAKTARTLADDTMDLSLPYIVIDDNGIPSIEGIALFSNQKFTGETLKKKEAVLANVMKNKLGKYTQLSYEWGQEDSVMTIEIINVGRKIKISKERINVDYDINIRVQEFHKDDLYKKEMRKEAEKFLAAEIKKDFEKIIKKTKEAKSDIIGFGRRVHAFHPELWKRGDWQETYSTIPIKVDVKVKMKRTNILD